MTDRVRSSSLQCSKVIVISCYPPRMCGIATFGRDTVAAMKLANPDFDISVIAMEDGGNTYDFGAPVISTIRQDDLGAYVEAASLINDQAPDCVIVQHEFGIFGGAAGEYLLTLLSLVKAPVLSILHTVLDQPDYNQMRVVRRLLHRSTRVMVMAQRGADTLRDVYGATADKIAVIPHGAPVRDYVEPAVMRAKLGIDCERMITTFGLLSPNKGIEHVIKAMPEIVAWFPSTKYLVLGATHPHLLAQEGEAYRDTLAALAHRLGVADNVVFVNRFLDEEDLFDYLQASDVYVTPYLNEAQITSGTLSYALALGSLVVSTPYWHAQEVFQDCPGALVAFADSGAIQTTVCDAFSDARGLNAKRREVYQWAQKTTWPSFGKRLLDLTHDAVRSGNRLSHISERNGPAYPAVSLKAIERMTDNCGILQHSQFGIPSRQHGYCVDDNARALVLANDIIRRGMLGPDIERLHTLYAGFVLHAFDGETGRFRNFMGFDRAWSRNAASEDSQGRAFWALGHAAATAQYSGNAGWAATLLQRCAGTARMITSPRARAFIMLGCGEAMQSDARSGIYDEMLLSFAEDMVAQFDGCRGDGWHWLEDTLTYDNGRIPQAVLMAGRLKGRRDLIEAALEMLEWLCHIQMVDHGLFAPVGSESFNQVRKPPMPYDQQPLEAAAMLAACHEAYLATRDEVWWQRAKTIFAWFYGLNSHDMALVDPITGHCHDGLNRSGLNLNAGAESLLAFQMSVCTYQDFADAVDTGSANETLNEIRIATRR